MKRSDLIRRVRSNTRDLASSIFRQVDIVDFINEGIDRIKSRVHQLRAMPYLDSDDQEVTLLPSHYQYLLAVYATSRCFGQDERHYQASTFMNEFETKLDELFNDVNEGVVVITDPDGNPIESTNTIEYVKIVYFAKDNTEEDIDDGVEGV